MQASLVENPDILESALDQAFSPPPRPLVQPAVGQEETSLTQEPQTVRSESVADADPSLSESVALDDSWKVEYETQVQSWRARSAEEREKAEKERLRWEAIRAIEKEEAEKRKSAGIVGEMDASPPQYQVGENWENVPSSSTAAESSSKPEEFQNLVGESEHLSPSHIRSEPAIGLPRTHSHQDTAMDESQKWEDVPSVTSSFPSLSYPEHIETPSPPHPQPVSQQAPVSVTLAIFDSSLSTRTRLTAFFSSLAVNLLLPFVNGVMLGFGEIFAKNIVMDWLGWKPSGPGSSATNVGIRPSPREQRQKENRFR
ncbi:hypothetical protein GALMADRAFT_247669 [Galerina marginata CBS 339.88]|uniref:TOM13-domain-containing protein n=1 Tax=Galerina marginata (strain CBS 339.88) TaxID=685588 RepID=A0A067T8S2_GALM3|nr:hypothetical protein GALMADRAFT_247669 [Galerina marginata CBS 339.88]